MANQRNSAVIKVFKTNGFYRAELWRPKRKQPSFSAAESRSYGVVVDACWKVAKDNGIFHITDVTRVKATS